MPGDRPSNSPWLRVVLAGATLFVLAAIAVGVVVLTGDDSGSASPDASTIAEGGFPAVPVQPEESAADNQGTSKPDDTGGQGGQGSKQPSEQPSVGGGVPDAEQPASDAKCPYGREQCKLLKQAWEDASSDPLKEGKCPRDYGREQCKLLQQSWEDAESHPIETGGPPKQVDCPYGREQCKLLWEAWQAANQ